MPSVGRVEINTDKIKNFHHMNFVESDKELFSKLNHLLAQFMTVNLLCFAFTCVCVRRHAFVRRDCLIAMSLSSGNTRTNHLHTLVFLSDGLAFDWFHTVCSKTWTQIKSESIFSLDCGECEHSIYLHCKSKLFKFKLFASFWFWSSSSEHWLLLLVHFGSFECCFCCCWLL